VKYTTLLSDQVVMMHSLDVAYALYRLVLYHICCAIRVWYLISVCCSAHCIQLYNTSCNFTVSTNIMWKSVVKNCTILPCSYCVVYVVLYRRTWL